MRCHGGAAIWAVFFLLQQPPEVNAGAASRPEGFVRVVDKPTRAAIDWALVERNELLDPVAPAQGAMGREVAFAQDLFPALFDPGSLALDRVFQPMAWQLLFPWLEKMDYDRTDGLARLNQKIQRERWGGKVPAQEITVAFVTTREDGSRALGVVVEFFPWTKVGAGFGDWNRNGRPDFSALVSPNILPPDSVIFDLLEDYQSTQLTAEEVAAHFAMVAGLWYNRYETYALDATTWRPENDPDLPAALREMLEQMGSPKPMGLLRGGPSGKWIYNILLPPGTPDRMVKPLPENEGGKQEGPFRQAAEAAPPVVIGEGALFLRDELRALEEPIPMQGEANPAAYLKTLHTELSRRGLRLLVVPVPTKAAQMRHLLPEGYASDDAGFRVFWQGMRSEGLEVVELREAVGWGGEARFLPNDTHWTPDGAARAARVVAQALLRTEAIAPPPPGEIDRFTMLGDLREMLPAEEKRGVRPMEVEFQRLDLPEALLNDESSEAEIVVVADSFGVVFQRSEPVRSGFVAHLAAAVKAPVRLVASQGSPTQAMAEFLRRGASFLSKKRVVIFLFSERFLVVDPGGWRPVPWERLPSRTEQAL